MWYAGGRGSSRNVGRHSLRTRNRNEAENRLRRLNHKCPVKQGLASDESVEVDSDLTVESAWRAYLNHCGRPEVTGGASPKTIKRYRAARDKFTQFCQSRSVRHWQQVSAALLDSYSRWLRDNNYADRTVYLELTTLKSLHKWLIETARLPQSAQFSLRLRRPEGTDTYCYAESEVRAMIQHCRETDGLAWMGDVILMLACTGLRTSELASLRRSDVDESANVIRLTDERGGGRRRKVGEERRTKGRRSRTIPIHPDLHRVIERLKPHSDGRLLHGPRGGRLKPDTVRNILVRDVIKALCSQFPTPPGEIGFEHGRVHSFRHYFVSQAFRAGVSEGEIMSWVGHRDSKMVAHYRHLSAEDAQRKMKQISFVTPETQLDGPARSTDSSHPGGVQQVAGSSNVL